MIKINFELFKNFKNISKYCINIIFQEESFLWLQSFVQLEWLLYWYQLEDQYNLHQLLIVLLWNVVYSLLLVLAPAMDHAILDVYMSTNSFIIIIIIIFFFYNTQKIYSIKIITVRPIAKIVLVTCAIFFLSIRSTAWNKSTSGTPYFMHAFWNLK